jgi:chaperone required for assembly of F1-ATPase
LRSYAGSDLVCYRADRPTATGGQQQAQHWDPVLEDARQVIGANFKTAKGIVHIKQDAAAISAVRAVAAAHSIPFISPSSTTLPRSRDLRCLSLMLVGGRVSAEQGWAAAHVDEDYQIRQWGTDHEAMARRAGRRLDL